MDYRICSPYVPPAADTADLADLSDQVAAAERVDNVRVVPLHELGDRPPLGLALGAPVRVYAAFEKLKLWDNGRTLRVRFLDGDPAVQAKVAAIAKEWQVEANLTLDFVTDGAADLRVSFAQKGFSWSTIGTDALTVGANDATVNFGWLEPDTELREYQRVVRHEFGHALGMIHEHQNPAAQGVIPWDKPKVYAYYAQQGWDHATVDHNIFDVYTEDSTNHSAFDPTSIMEYAIPDSLTVGSYAIGWNTELSALDKQYMHQQYPKGAAGLQEIVPDGPRLDGDLATSGEVDLFHFTVGDPKTFIMTTTGPTDTVLTLHGPNDQGAVLAFDDDSGLAANARIVRKLLAGEYWLAVRHKDPTATGTYSVGITIRK